VGTDLLLSFDARVTLGGVTAEREDLVRFNGSSYTLYFDGSAAGIPAGLNLDAADSLGGGNVALALVSECHTGQASASVERQGVLEYNLAKHTWEIAYDGSAQHSDWSGANLDAVALPEPGALLQLLAGAASILMLGRIRTRL